MSPIQLFIDEDSMDRRLVQALRARAVDILTVGEIGSVSLSDEEQLIISTKQQRVLYTFNVGDFCQLHTIYMSESRTHAGIVISLQEYSIGNKCDEY